jgi:hypothetical protein
MEVVFSVPSVPRLNNEDQLPFATTTEGVSGITHVEAGSNTSTMTLRVVGGDEKGTVITNLQLHF